MPTALLARRIDGREPEQNSKRRRERQQRQPKGRNLWGLSRAERNYWEMSSTSSRPSEMAKTYNGTFFLRFECRESFVLLAPGIQESKGHYFGCKKTWLNSAVYLEWLWLFLECCGVEAANLR